MARTLHRQSGAPIWLFGSRMACYPAATEQLIKARLIEHGVAPEAIVCSGDMEHVPDSLDTVQEAMNVAAVAKSRGIQTVVCISNRLQLWQVRGLLRRQGLTLLYAATPLRERRWWYLVARLALIPLAFAGIGSRFLPLKLVRRARAGLAKWRF